VKGVLSIALEAKRRCRQTLVVPNENAAEAAVVEGVDVYGACWLLQVVHFLRGDIALEPVRSTNGWPAAESAEQDLDFGEVKGQQHVKRAVEIALPAATISSPLELFRLEHLRVSFFRRARRTKRS
jgi:magnesium chelatase family protein